MLCCLLAKVTRTSSGSGRPRSRPSTNTSTEVRRCKPFVGACAQCHAHASLIDSHAYLPHTCVFQSQNSRRTSPIEFDEEIPLRRTPSAGRRKNMEADGAAAGLTGKGGGIDFAARSKQVPSMAHSLPPYLYP